MGRYSPHKGGRSLPEASWPFFQYFWTKNGHKPGQVVTGHYQVYRRNTFWTCNKKVDNQLSYIFKCV